MFGTTANGSSIQSNKKKLALTFQKNNSTSCFRLIPLVDCKKRLFDEDDTLEQEKEISERTSIKKQKITCTSLIAFDGEFLI